jgi:hypothetical protein
MEAISEMKNTAKSPMCITFKGSFPHKHNTTNLSMDHAFKAAKYIFEMFKLSSRKKAPTPKNSK